MTEAQRRRNDMNILSWKRCTRCKTWKAKSEFGKDASRKDGLSNKCRQCDRERGRKYHEENPDKRREKSRKWSKSNPEKVSERKRKWYESNPDKVHEQNRNWREANRDKSRAYEEARRARSTNRRRNLKAMCQRCHLLFDLDEHIANAKATRRRRLIEAGQLEMRI
jgi:hypothetical protein